MGDRWRIAPMDHDGSTDRKPRGSSGYLPDRWIPGVREYEGPGYTAVTILHDRVVDACPHRHATRAEAQACAELMVCVRTGQEAPRG